MLASGDEIISIVAGGLGGLGSLSLIISFLYNRHLRTPATFKIFIMALCDLPLALTLPILTGGPCKLAAFATTFFIVATCSWNCLIAFDLHKIINGKGVPKDLSFWAHLFAWLPSAVAAVAPVSVDSYGEPEMQGWLICWYHESEDILKLAIVVPLSIHMIFITFLLFEFLVKGRSVLRSSPRIQKRVTRHLFLFVLVFFLLWPLLIVSCIQDIILIDDRVDWLDDVAFFCFKSSGFWNFIVWINSPVFSHARQLHRKRQLRYARAPSTENQDSDDDFLSSDSDSDSEEEEVEEPPGRIGRNWSKFRSSFERGRGEDEGSLQKELLGGTKSYRYSDGTGRPDSVDGEKKKKKRSKSKRSRHESQKLKGLSRGSGGGGSGGKGPGVGGQGGPLPLRMNNETPISVTATNHDPVAAVSGGGNDGKRHPNLARSPSSSSQRIDRAQLPRMGPPAIGRGGEPDEHSDGHGASISSADHHGLNSSLDMSEDT